jgi:hypothetical protein
MVRGAGRLRARAALAVIGAVAIAAPLGLSAVSSAAEHATVTSDDPADWTPHVLDGRVRGMATVGGTTVVVGDFTRVREQGSTTAIARSDIFAFDSTGKVSTTFVPTVTGSEVFDVIPSGDGQSVYIAGSFSAVNGAPRTTRVTRLDVQTGQVVSSFRAPSFNNQVTALDLVGNKLYAAGWFTRVGGQPRTLLTALDATTGADLGTVNLTFAGTWNGGTLGVSEMTIQPDGTDLVVIGNFRTVQGQSRPQIAMVDLTGPTATLDSWHTTRYSTTCSRSFETYMWGLDASPDGKYFAIGTTGAYSGGPSTGTLCDTVARWEFDAVGPNQNPTWIDYTGGDTVTDIEVTGAAIYAGGHFRWMNNPYSSDRTGPGAVRRMGLAALDPRNGLPFSWNPGRARGWGVWGFASNDQGLWIGHDTATVGGETHERLALMPLVDGTGVIPPDNTGSLPANVYLAGLPVGGGFDNQVAYKSFSGSTVSGTGTADAGGVSWSGSRASTMIDGRVYTTWSDGTFTHRGYNGVRFGTAATVNLNALTAFADESRAMTAMWFDRVTGRLYFTLSGTNRLYYRYFTPESRIVGGIRYEVSAPGIDLTRVTGGFLAGGNLYYRTTDGALNRVAWSNGPTGSSTVVSGPGVDGVSWSSRSLFLFAG